MATPNAALRNAKRDAYKALDRLQLLDGVTVLATVVVAWVNGADGVITADPDAVQAADAGQAKGARLYSSLGGGEELPDLLVQDSEGDDWNGDPAPAAFVRLQQVGCAISQGQSIDFGAMQITTATTFNG